MMNEEEIQRLTNRVERTDSRVGHMSKIVDDIGQVLTMHGNLDGGFECDSDDELVCENEPELKECIEACQESWRVFDDARETLKANVEKLEEAWRKLKQPREDILQQIRDEKHKERLARTDRASRPREKQMKN